MSTAAIPPIGDPPTVRVVYLVPSDRVEKPYAVPCLQYSIRVCHSWYADEMEKWGYGRKTFRYETEADGVTPKVHVVHVAQSQSYFYVEGSWWESWIAAKNAGVPIDHDGEVWLVSTESHQPDPDGRMYGTAYGSIGEPLSGAPRLGGNSVAQVGADYLKFANATDLKNNTSMAGVTDPDVSPYEMTGIWPWPATYADAASPMIGGIAHELGHSFGLPHCGVGSGGSYPNLMSWGNWIFNGSVYPDVYPHGARLSEYAAEILNLSPYFTTEKASPHLFAWRDDTPTPSGTIADQNVPVQTVSSVAPHVNVLTRGTQSLQDGKLRIEFTASDPEELAFALLYWTAEGLVDYMPLSGASFSGAFETPFFGSPYRGSGEQEMFEVVVFNTHGNGDLEAVYIAPTYGAEENLSPRAQIEVRQHADVGQWVSFSGFDSVDPGASLWDLQFEWDLDGDGIFEVSPPVGNPTTSHKYSTPGVKRARLRVTDPQGISHMTPWVTIQVWSTLVGDTNCDGVVDRFDIDSFVLALVTTDGYLCTYQTCDIMHADTNGDGTVDVFDIDPFVALIADN